MFHTEEMQIIDTIKLNAANGILKSQHENQQEIMANERIVQNEKARDKDQRDVDLIMNIGNQIAILRAS